MNKLIIKPNTKTDITYTMIDKYEYIVNRSTKKIDDKYVPLFKWLIVNRDTILKYCVTSYYCYSLSLLLKCIQSKDKIIYELFKEFYGLIDESIKDYEYHSDFQICINYNNGYCIEDNVHMYITTYFRYNDCDYNNNHIIDFENFIEYYKDIPIVLEWKESLFNKEF